VIDRLLAVPSHLRERLASALESGILPPQPSAPALESVLGAREHNDAVIAILGELYALGVSGRAAAAWIRMGAEGEARRPRADLVWSGPEVVGLHARDTRRVFEELIESAQQSLYISTYVYFDGPKAFDALARRMTTSPDLRVTLLLNIQRMRGDTTASDHLVRKFADRLWKVDWPGTVHPHVFYDPRAVELDASGGVLHAKAVVADDEVVFVTSANLTEAAFERNIELGLLVRDRTLAASASAHFRQLIENGLLRPLPAE
jgi:phosphatidylserine/phosphatidylglycerophosphate/cardiolipin synthase-like enzyme